VFAVLAFVLALALPAHANAARVLVLSPSGHVTVKQDPFVPAAVPTPAPPVLATADAGIVASLTDGVLLVVRAGATDRNAAQRAYQQLANVGGRVVGTVLNDPGGEVAKEGYYYYPYDYAAEEQ